MQSLHPAPPPLSLPELSSTLSSSRTALEIPEYLPPSSPGLSTLVGDFYPGRGVGLKRSRVLTICARRFFPGNGFAIKWDVNYLAFLSFPFPRVFLFFSRFGGFFVGRPADRLRGLNTVVDTTLLEGFPFNLRARAKKYNGVLFQNGFINFYLEIKAIGSPRVQPHSIFNHPRICELYFSMWDTFEIYQ